MYKPYEKEANQMLLPGDFFLPFGGKLNPDNRWCKLAQLIPWAKVDQKYAKEVRTKSWTLEQEDVHVY